MFIRVKSNQQSTFNLLQTTHIIRFPLKSPYKESTGSKYKVQKMSGIEHLVLCKTKTSQIQHIRAW